MSHQTRALGVIVRIFTLSTGGERSETRDILNEYTNIEPNLLEVKFNFLIGYMLTLGKLN